MRAQRQTNMLELKYARIQEHVIRLQNDLARPRINISDASARTTRDPLLPSIWAEGRADDPYGPQQKGGCSCIIS